MSRGTIIKEPDEPIMVSIIFLIPPKDKEYRKVCVLDDNGNPTGKKIKIIPREFPPKFVYAETCDGTGQQVEFDQKRYWFFWKRAKITDFNPPKSQD